MRDLLDEYLLSFALLLVLSLQLPALIYSYITKSETFVDLSSSLSFILVALVCFTTQLPEVRHAREILLLIFVCIWAVRLGGFLFYRVRQRGGDSRFEQMRGKFHKIAGFFVIQTVYIWTLSLPIIMLYSPHNTRLTQPTFGSASDIIGIILFVFGLTLETWADAVKSRFKSTKQPGFCDRAPWNLCRAPNYAGEIFVWWGLFSLAYTNTVTQKAAVVSPVFLTLLLMFLSGLPNLKDQGERYLSPEKSEEEREQYRAYLRRTSVLIPMPPVMWKIMPRFLKRTIGLDWPLYNHREETESQRSAV